MTKEIIHTAAAPDAIGTYSQAVRVANQLYVSGQIPLDPSTMQLISDDITMQIKQAFNNLLAIISAAQAKTDDVVKLTIYLTDLEHFAIVNEVMAMYFTAPYPARAVIGVKSLPKGAAVEIDAILILK